MERQQSNSLQNFDVSKAEILKKRLLKSTITSAAPNLALNNSQQNVVMSSLRAPISSSMIVSSVQAPQSAIPISSNMLMSSVQGPQNSIPITHNLLSHPVKIHTNNSYPLQLSTVHVPVQIPGSTSNISVPVHLSGPTSSVPLQLQPTVSLPIQVSGTTTVPVQLSAGETINVPLQIPAANQNIHLTTSTLPSMPLLHNTNQLHSSIFHVQMGSNQQATLDGNSDINVSSSSQLQLHDSNGVQVKLNPSTSSQMQVGPNPAIMQMTTSNNSIHLTLPNTVNAGTVQLRGANRAMPHMVYIQTPTGLKPVTSSEVITQASSSGNPPQIIVRRPGANTGNIHLISNMGNKANFGTKLAGQNMTSVLTTSNSTVQPIVIQKPKPNEKLVPVSVSSGTGGKQAITYLGSVKKSSLTKISDNQSILIPNNQAGMISHTKQKVFLTPMNVPKMQNTKFILPVTLPATMSTKGPVINLQISNGQIQNDPQGNIKVMRETGVDNTEMPPLQPLAKSMNGKENPNTMPQSPTSDKAFATSIPGSRAEPTGEQEYSLSIPETNTSMNDDIYTLSIADEEGGQAREKSFNLAFPAKGKSLLNKHVLDRNEIPGGPVPAPAILRRSNSDNSERKMSNANLKRRISLCNENIASKNAKFLVPAKQTDNENHEDIDNSDYQRVPSLFCDEKLERDLEIKANMGESDQEDFKDGKFVTRIERVGQEYEFNPQNEDEYVMETVRIKRVSVDSALEEDPPGLIWSNGIAMLQGSRLHFQTNEFGLIDMIDSSDHEKGSALNHNAKYNTPLKQRIERSGRDKKPTSPEDMYRCDGCGCHGMAAEFITPNFCSVTCQSEVQKVSQKKREKERMELLKKRGLKRLLRKQQSESDLQDSKEQLRRFDASPAESRLSEANLLKMEESIENEKYPWMCGKNGFSWMRYLEFCKAKAAMVKLFKDPFPYNRNGFKIGMRMEAIDPCHASVFCVVSVAEVQGYRLRLHFDDYPESYDYWVNADCVDVFPAGYCEKNGRSLKPPTSMATNFSWPMYLKQVRAVTAPRHLFPHMSTTMIKPNGFRTGMKLEAEDRKNNLVCVATVADMLDNRMLIHFDSWDEMYDCWVDPTSPYIHPVGWAQDQAIPLTPPNFYKDPEAFSWEAYLAETGAAAAPARAFKTRPPQGFRAGMKLEVVDKRVPFLIRVATISEVKGHQVRVSFDGWPDELAYWLDDDSPDIHPVGWCLKTGHPLEPPLTAEELAVAGGCGYGGCRGLGSLRGGSHKQHVAASSCPYRERDAPTPPPRLARDLRPLPIPRRIQEQSAKSVQAITPNSPVDPIPRRGRPPKHKRVEEVTKTETQVSDEESLSSSGGKRWRGSNTSKTTARDIESCVLREYSPRAAHTALGPKPDVLGHMAQLALPRDAAIWTQTDVTALVTRLSGAAAGAAVAAARLSGRELLMASREELVDCARLRLGPAIKLYGVISQLRAAAT